MLFLLRYVHLSFCDFVNVDRSLKDAQLSRTWSSALPTGVTGGKEIGQRSPSEDEDTFGFSGL